jgi:hypothetical protein
MKLSYSTTPRRGGAGLHPQGCSPVLYTGLISRKGGIILRDLADGTLILWGEPLGGSRISYFWAGAVGGELSEWEALLYGLLCGFAGQRWIV